MPGGRIEAQIYFSSTQTATLDHDGTPGSVSFAAGTYYISDLVTEFESDAGGDWSCTISTTDLTGTGKITIDHTTAAAFSVTWGSTTIRDVFGFTGNISAAGSAQTGSYAAKGIWIPDQPMFARYGGLNHTGVPVTNARATISALGHVKGLVGSVANVYDGIAWSGITAARTWAYSGAGGANSTPVNLNWETFMRETQYGGVVSYFRPYSPVRLYWDGADSSYTSGTLQIPQSWEPEQMQAGWLGRYNITLPRLWKTPA
jgi:hypothetical protein